MKRLFFLLLLMNACYWAKAQKIYFSSPSLLLENAKSDAGPDLASFKGRQYAIWKEQGSLASIHLTQLREHIPGQLQQNDMIVTNATTIGKPAIAASGDILYLFWITEEGNIAYTIYTEENTTQAFEMHTLPGDAGTFNATLGINAIAINGKIILATRGNTKDRLYTIVCDASKDGIIDNTALQEIKGARSVTYPSMVNVDAKARYYWIKGDGAYYIDYDPVAAKWSKQQTFAEETALNMLVTYSGLDKNKVICIRSNKSNNQLQYQVTDAESNTGDVSDLPAYFAPVAPVALCSVDDNNFIMAYTGQDKRLYLTYGSGYHSASWMEEMLFPEKENYSLKDIVIPGAHDAGMSVLTAIGGKSAYTINECNTLTQTMNVAQQLNAGIRMFDLRIDMYQGRLYAKHAPSDCMDDAVGGGYGEPLGNILTAVKSFLDIHKKEVVILSFCHFCDRHLSIENQAKMITDSLGKDKLFDTEGRTVKDIPLKDLAGKVLVSFEEHAYPQMKIVANTMTDRSSAFFNYKRAYAATNLMDNLLDTQKNFLNKLKGHLDDNDIIRLDWQLTQRGQEAAITCSQFQSDKANVLLDGALLLVNVMKKNKSIIDLARSANRYLPVKVAEWIKDGTINKENKPNVLYVDAAGNWITDFCVDLNKEAVYQK